MMINTDPILSVATFFSAFIGAVFGVFVDRLWRRVESVPLFEISLGRFWSRTEGEGRSVNITNIGLDELPKYRIALFHPDRGTMDPFEPNDERVFPQYPHQTNSFRVVTAPRSEISTEPLKKWFESDRDGTPITPDFQKYTFQIVLCNSDRVLLKDKGLGNTLAKDIYQDLVQKKVEQSVKEITFKSQAPIWVRIIKHWQAKRFLRKLTKQRNTEQ